MSEYDVVVIGSGPGGYVAAIHAAQHGHKTAIVEREPTKRLGGTCLLRGCIPTKAMLHTADLLYDMRRSETFGIVSEEPTLDMVKMSKYRAKIVRKNAGGVTYLFLPDPFLRSNATSQADDPFIAEFESLLPSGADYKYTWVDDWDIYHMGLGEVHCGTNVIRTPNANWWEVGMHLLED